METRQTQQMFDEQVPLAERESIGGLECTKCGARWVGFGLDDDGRPSPWVPCSCPAPCDTCDPETVERGMGCTCGWVGFLFVRLTPEELERTVEERHARLMREMGIDA